MTRIKKTDTLPPCDPNVVSIFHPCHQCHPWSILSLVRYLRNQNRAHVLWVETGTMQHVQVNKVSIKMFIRLFEHVDLSPEKTEGVQDVQDVHRFQKVVEVCFSRLRKLTDQKSCEESREAKMQKRDVSLLTTFYDLVSIFPSRN